MFRNLRLKRSDGFTLLEVLVALTLLSVVATLMQVGLNSISFRHDKLRAELARLERLTRGETALRNILEQSWSGPIKSDSQQFQGTRDSATFLVELPEQFGSGGPRPVTITTERRSDRNDLMLVVPAERSTGAPASRETVFTGITSVAFEYGRLDANSHILWSSDWRRTDENPVLVKVTVILSNSEVMTIIGGGRRSPSPL